MASCNPPQALVFNDLCWSSGEWSKARGRPPSGWIKVRLDSYLNLTIQIYIRKIQKSNQLINRYRERVGDTHASHTQSATTDRGLPGISSGFRHHPKPAPRHSLYQIPSKQTVLISQVASRRSVKPPYSWDLWAQTRGFVSRRGHIRRRYYQQKLLESHTDKMESSLAKTKSVKVQKLVGDRNG